LEGPYPIPVGTDQYTHQLLQHLCIPLARARKPEISPEINTASHVQSWKRLKKIKASDSRSLSAAHYIAGIQYDKIAEVDAMLRSIPSQIGIVPEAWLSVTDCSIPKSANVLEAAKMRTIVLFPSDANMNNKYFASTMMRESEALTLLHKAQAGSRRLHRSSFVALNKRLTMDIQRQQRLPGLLLL
jgi:hypothetical protein